MTELITQIFANLTVDKIKPVTKAEVDRTYEQWYMEDLEKLESLDMVDPAFYSWLYAVKNDDCNRLLEKATKLVREAVRNSWGKHAECLFLYKKEILIVTEPHSVKRKVFWLDKDTDKVKKLDL